MTNHTNTPTSRTPAVRVARGLLAVILLAGVGVAVWWAWLNFGTTIIANRQADAAVADFDRHAPLRNPAVCDLNPPHTAPLGYTQVVGLNTPTWGVLHIPSWRGLPGTWGDRVAARMPIADGTGPEVLDRAFAGRIMEFPAAPGEVGNISLSGHRRTYGNNFLHLDRLQEGDQLIIETANAWFIYEVTVPPFIVPPDQWQVLAPVPNRPDHHPRGRYITLTTCHSIGDGAWGNDHRMIVHGQLTGWMYRNQCTPPNVTDD